MSNLSRFLQTIMPRAIKTFHIPALCLFFSSFGYAQPTSPPTANDDTVLLLHFDGALTDAGGWEHVLTPRGKEPQWSPGRFGQALKLDGESLLAAPNRSALHVGGQSWTVQAWIKPGKEQPAHSVVLAGGWGSERQYGIRISYGKILSAFFMGGPEDGGFVSSPDLSASLFDGNWHHVAAVLDRGRHGEVRLYLDGKQVAVQKPVFSSPIVFEAGVMGVAIGNAAPWSKTTESYRGLIDEVKISRIVEPQYAAATPLPPELVPAAPVKAPFQYNPADSQKPLELSPQNTIIALHGGAVESNTAKAALLLQKYLRQIYRVPDGFAIATENKIEDITGKAVIALGNTRWAEDNDTANLSRDGFTLKRKANVLVIAGDQSSGTYAGVVSFLDEFAGIRFYMPGELWTSSSPAQKIVLPAIDRTTGPFVVSLYMSGMGSVPGEAQWMERNSTFRRPGGTHQHSMWQMFPPERYAEKYPQIYPIVKGRRYLPQSIKDQAWQPNFATPQLLDAAEESALRYFREYPTHAFLAFSIQDGHVFDESPASLQVVKEFEQKISDPARARVAAYSHMYWNFMNQLAGRLEKKLPGKLLVGLAYNAVRMPPGFKLHPNIVVYTNFHIAELDADKILQPNAAGVSPLDEWLALTSHYGNHDWVQGNGYLIPRTYTGYFARFLKAIKARGVKDSFQHIEAYPNWGLDGPKYFIINRLMSNPDEDVDQLWQQFSTDMFGPAATPMQGYFQTLEKLWIQLGNVEGPERKLFNWKTQFNTTPQSMALVREARAHLDKASTLATTTVQKERIHLFSKTFRLSEMLFDIASQTTVKQSQLDAVQKHFTDEIANDPMTLYPGLRNPNYLADNVLPVLTTGKKIEP